MQITAWTPRRWILSLVTTGCLGLLALAAGPAAAADGSPAAVAAGHSQRIDHTNVGAAHSPQLLKQLAGPVQSSSTVNSATTAPAVVLPNASQGVDVASYQHPSGAATINWANVASAGINFAAVKVTEGAYYVNPYAKGDLTNAKAAGLAVIAYAFAIPNGDGASSSPVVQADYALAHAAGQDGNASPIMLDIEYDPYKTQDGTNDCYGLSQSAMVTWISGFVTEVKNKTGLYPIIYSTTDWWKSCTGNSASFGNDPLWIAAYTANSSPGTLPAGWPAGGWTFWQYTSQGTVNGISGNVDLDQLSPGFVSVLSPGTQQTAVGTPAKLRILATGGTGLTYGASGLPSGLSIDTATGVISGTPSATGASNVTITATGSSGSASVSFTWYIHGTVTVTSPGNRSTVAGSPVDFPVTASDSISAPPMTFSATGLPRGVSISSGGLITGWPDTPRTYHPTVTATDSLKGSGSASFTWTISAAPGTGPTGPVKLDLGGKCLNDVGNSSANGTQIDIWTCNGSSAQRWTYAQDLTLRIHGKCLTAQAKVGRKVLLEPCTGATAGEWMLVYPRSVRAKAGTVPLTLVNPASKWCLADPGSTSNGTRMLAGTCNGATDQAWVVPAGPVASQLPGKCLDDHANSTANGSKIDLYACNGTAAQRWTTRPDGTIRVHGKCLDVHHGGTASGTPVDLWSCNGTSAQQWHLVPIGAGVAAVNPRSGKCLTDPGDSTTNGTALKIATCAGAPGQRWRAR